VQIFPIINPDYAAPLFFRNGHIHTIYPTLFRQMKDVAYQRERIETPDQEMGTLTQGCPIYMPNTQHNLK
jgi:predicted alpha/beta-fold hydrolase